MIRLRFIKIRVQGSKVQGLKAQVFRVLDSGSPLAVEAVSLIKEKASLKLNKSINMLWDPGNGR